MQIKGKENEDMNNILHDVDIKNEIMRLKKLHNAVIVAHNYQVDEVQEIADMVGDSLALSRYCAKSDADVIVFCGVHFMAESAKILSPDKTVLLPEIGAGCPMADMATPEAVREMREKYPEAAVVCYINSSAAVKAECDICCTSSNAIKIVESIDKKDIIFLPDQNLGNYVSKKVLNADGTPAKNIIPWEGYCITHHRVNADNVKKAKELHPDAKVLIHPECTPEVVAMADFVGSTKEIIDYARSSNDQKFIIGTEMGVMYQLKNENPEKTFYLMTPGLVCPNMKKTSLKSVYLALKEMRYKIDVDKELAQKALLTLERMLAVQ